MSEVSLKPQSCLHHPLPSSRPLYYGLSYFYICSTRIKVEKPLNHGRTRLLSSAFSQADDEPINHTINP